ncbi:MAG: GNAT family N-acetyltransferase [Lentisphaeria bacterium]|nr:GNAT family N-acetyltransferase [Lentisphaeria bacterium]
MAEITLTPLAEDDWEQFILDNQYAFKYGAMEEFGERDAHFEEDGEIISRKTIEESMERGVSYRIREDGRIVGGLVLQIDEKTRHNHLDLLFIRPEAHSRGIGSAAWREVERLYPETEVWETCTPYFETRNIHFYVNKCGFHIVEFFNPKHPDPHEADTPGGELFLRFEKEMKRGDRPSPSGFRPAVAEDRGTIQALYASVKGTAFCVWNNEYPVDDEIDMDLANGNLLVLTNGAEIVGALSVSDENELDTLNIWNARDDVAEIARVCILPSWQGNGLAGLLLKRAEAWLAAKGFKTVHLLVERRHLPAIKTYLNAGYEIMGRCGMYGHDYYACEKILSVSTET